MWHHAWPYFYMGCWRLSSVLHVCIMQVCYQMNYLALTVQAWGSKFRALEPMEKVDRHGGFQQSHHFVGIDRGCMEKNRPAALAKRMIPRFYQRQSLKRVENDGKDTCLCQLQASTQACITPTPYSYTWENKHICTNTCKTIWINLLVNSWTKTSSCKEVFKTLTLL